MPPHLLQNAISLALIKAGHGIVSYTFYYDLRGVLVTHTYCNI